MEGKIEMAIVIAVCGLKNSGKTTLIEKLVSRMSGCGVRVAVIKHDGHDFACDIPDTDTYRFSKSGAYGVAAFSDNRMFIHRQGMGETEQEIMQMFPEAEVILIEGLKESKYRKIEVIRGAISKEPVSDKEGRFLIVTDLPQDFLEETCLGFDEIDKIVDMIMVKSDE